jgi:hypothetical protein
MTQPAGSAELSVRQGGVGIDVVKWQADIDFRHPQRFAGGQRQGVPTGALTDEDRERDTVLLQDDLALD